MKATARIVLLLCALQLLICKGTRAQDTTKQRTLADSAAPGFAQQMQQLTRKIQQQAIKDRQADKEGITQNIVFDLIKKTMQRAKSYLKSGIDTIGILDGLKDIADWQNLAGDGIFNSSKTTPTYRNLTVTYNLLLAMQTKLQAYKANLDGYKLSLESFKYKIDSLASDSSMYTLATDSAALKNYMLRLVAMAREVAPTDSMLEKAVKTVAGLQATVDLQAYAIEAAREELILYQHRVYQATLGRQYTNIWSPAADETPFRQILHYSVAKSWLTLKFYAKNNVVKILLLVLLTITSTIYLKSLKKIYATKNMLVPDFSGQLVLRYPALSAIVIVFNIFQFIFIAPPFLFSSVLWLFSATALSIVLYRFISRYWLLFWLTMLVLFIMACGDNSILQPGRVEQWFMLLLSVAGVIIGLRTMLKGDRETLKEQWIMYAIGLMAALEFVSVIANCFGRYNFAKALMVSGYLNVVIAIMFLWTVRLINEGLSLAVDVYSVQDKKLFYINFGRVGSRAPVIFYFFMVIGWFILFGHNFYAYNLIEQPVKDFLSKERSLGDYDFTINSLLLFVFILFLSVVVSRIVSYFASDRHLPAGVGAAAKGKRPGIGSWLLLVRIGIISIGLFLAFSAAGISMDKIAIIIGALGVGIGFGLQTLVNNLVSGLIIAFEKPVNVGDVVEIENHKGTVKSIGFRSSVITTWNGADLVMPNGDLLNFHLVNWTLAGGRRQMNLAVNVAYGTDLAKTKALLLDVMAGINGIAKSPAPTVIFQELGSSSIEVNLSFWVATYGEGSTVRSNLIIAISDAFKQHNITMPFPQSDVHIYNAGSNATGNLPT